MKTNADRYLNILNMTEDYLVAGYKRKRSSSEGVSFAGTGGGQEERTAQGTRGPELGREAQAVRGSVPVDGGERMESIYHRVRECSKCGLSSTRNLAVPGTGALSPSIMIIGEGPGAGEDKQGLPFVGKAGQYLDKWMEAINLSREKDLYITNIVKCRPPENRDPKDEEISACYPYLKEQLKLLSPPVILVLGRVAARVLLETQDTMGKLRLRTHRYQGIPLFCTYHPSAVLRNPDLRKPVWEDLQKVSKLLGSL